MAIPSPALHVLDTPEGEIALLTALISFRPVGLQKHWAMVSILLYLNQRLGEGKVTGEQVWTKLRTLYNLEMLDEDSDLNAKDEATTQGEDPALAASSRKRRRRLSGSALAPVEPVDTSLLGPKGDFNIIDQRAFQQELARRRKSSHSPSPGFMPVDSEDNEDVNGDDGENTVTLANQDEDHEGSDRKESKSPVSRRGKPGGTRGRGGRKATTPGTAGRRGAGRRGGLLASPRGKRSKRDVDDDAISESASTLSALSEDGDGERKAGKGEENNEDVAGASEDEEEEVMSVKSEVDEAEEADVASDEEEEPEDNDEEQDDDQEAAVEDAEAADSVSSSEPDIGADDTPFKTPKAARKRQQPRKTRKSSAAAEEDNDEEMEDGGDDNADEAEESEPEAKSPTVAQRRPGRPPKNANKAAAASTALKSRRSSKAPEGGTSAARPVSTRKTPSAPPTKNTARTGRPKKAQ